MWVSYSLLLGSNHDVDDVELGGGRLTPTLNKPPLGNRTGYWEYSVFFDHDVSASLPPVQTPLKQAFVA